MVLGMQKSSHAAPAEVSFGSGRPIFPFASRIAHGKSGSPATTCCLKTSASAATDFCFRQAVLDDVAAHVVRMGAGWLFAARVYTHPI